MRGGKRPGAGRKPGSLTEKTREIAVRAAEEGITPLEVMIQTMRAAWEAGDKSTACSVAKDAAPYIHARLISSEAKTEVTHHYVVRAPSPIPAEAWQRKYSPDQTIQ